MKRNRDDLVREEMNKEHQLPASIRLALDQSYAQIQKQSKKKAKKSWLKPVSAAAAALALSSAILLTNDTALARLQAFFDLSDPGIELAAENGDVQNLAQAQQSENITMTLNHFFVDAYRLGLQITIESQHISKDNLNDLSFEYRLFDSAGKEIDALVSDTKAIAGPGIYTGLQFQLTNVQNNSATVELLAESRMTTAPSLEGAQLVVETVHFNNDEGGITSVNGEWAFSLTSPTIVKQQYIANNTVSGITLNEAVVSNGSMHITFTIDEINIGETISLNTALIDERGQVFHAQGNSFKEFEQQTEVSLVFPYSVWNEQQKLSLKVNDYVALTLSKKH